MKTKEFIKFLNQQDCLFIREESIIRSFKIKKNSSVPRHKEVKNNRARKICRDLEIPYPQIFQ